MVEKAMVRVTFLFSQGKGTILRALQQVAGFAIQFVVQDIVKKRAVRRDYELQTGWRRFD